MTSASSNLERLRALYDPHYVRHVESSHGAPVQVCLDSRVLQDAAGTGVATYARMLAKSLPDAGAAPLLLDDGGDDGARARLHRWMAATRAGPRQAAPENGGEDEAPAQWIVRDVFREAQVFFNLHGRALRIEMTTPPQVMHWTYPLPLYVAGARNLYSVHDLIPITNPQLSTINPARHRAILREVVRNAYAVVTVSECVRREIVAHLAMPPARVINTYQGVDAPLQTDPPLPGALRSGRYFLFCGRVERRKNLARLVEAHARSGTAQDLVIVGPEVPGEEALETLLRRQPGVVRLPWLPRPELLALMRRARALLFPSLAEGFGLPVAEAMVLGCPVLTSDRGALAEVAAQAALLVDPQDVAALAEGIGRLDTDDVLCGRLREAGFARGKMFGQDVYARRLRALYADALAAPGCAA
ncbi:D-inositol-3-phosphate glycosyltransferase [Sphingomonas sp. S2M10]|uniref:glycosyltransferase family 4 protein n=1 Tax=Sphingomonas sp. S2M10 TaxID=2705010 RepID=UPI001456A134|nr:glycosyltransferase family 1 protein [Sphingomonas sp. S2M10]NLS28358.1 D-inositol-3-phosphate glycosyltransferase [Sphingomonas sp. S2M10]